VVLFERLTARRGVETMDRKDIFLSLILVALLGIVGKMDYNDAQAENKLTHRAESTQ